MMERERGADPRPERAAGSTGVANTETDRVPLARGPSDLKGQLVLGRRILKKRQAVLRELAK